ncbi:lipopolysaccharide biosynthesis protein [Schumannella sp. 10F1B-5-1]|uniref:lipopolysaccharide biosynthesis protein n=1 Tax=Schumannella sp. 10F1B-5-1 TaxID=2590780 RepID=UPI0015E83CD6|nr:polysaccharide biosynthesis C-terminal domain-containing protein [Schumannella sp. 10F1B-5-1]
MTAAHTATADDGSADRRRLARGGGLSFVGSAVSAALGFVATVVVTRALGDAGAGQVLQLMGVLTIAMSFGRLGMDSVGVWLMPRLVDEPQRIRGALTLQLGVALLGGAIAALAIALVLPGLGIGIDTELLRATAAFVPAGCLALTALAALRGLGELRGYVVLGSVALPLARVALLVVAALALATPLALGLAWSAALAPLALAAVAVLIARARRTGAAAGVRGPWLADGALVRRTLGYALPRTLSAVLEQGLLWLSVILVGALAGSAAAGDYGAASRLIAAGLIIDTAVRVVVSPRFSALLHAGRLAETEALYRTAASWLVLFSAPIYLLLGVFAPLVLGWFGDSFRDGAIALAILCGGAIVTFLAGNVHSLLLMSGRSGWAAGNKAAVLALNIVANLILIPLLGVTGAAIAWAGSMLLDALLATVEVRLLLGIRPGLAHVLGALLVPLVLVGIPAVALRWLLGATPGALAAAVAISAIGLLVWARLAGRRHQLDELVAAFRRRG